MKLISEADVQDLQWTLVKRWKCAFELRSGDEVLARLYPQRGTHSMIGEAADGHWAFKRRGFWNADIVVTDLASQAEIAVLKQGRKGGRHLIVLQQEEDAASAAATVAWIS